MASGLDELLSGESSQIEYKVARPKDAKKYLKTVVAFANGQGGTLVFGVDDKTREVKGVPPEDVFTEMDAIANAIGDACVPTIVPSIAIQEAHGKSVIVVKVDQGKQVPYYLKSEGLQEGVYIRSGATSRPADFDYVRAMMLESAPCGFDRLPNRDAVVTEDSVRTLCAQIKSIALRRSKNDEERATVKDVTERQLLKWGVLERRDGELQATNAYAILTGETEEPAWRMQCAVFRGQGRSLFLDRRVYAGSVMDQIDQAYDYVLSKINVGANFDGLVRQDVYEIPLWPIREIITNAVLHRLYTSSSCVQVCLFDDRLEVTSPGGLVRGITLEEALTGRSELRNKALGQAFYYMKLIENWGTGIGRVIDDVTEFGLREPEFKVSDSQFRVNVFRLNHEEFESKLRAGLIKPIVDGDLLPTGTIDRISDNKPDSDIKPDNKSDNNPDSDIKPDNKSDDSDPNRKLLDLLASDPHITQAQLAKRLGIARSTLAARLADLQAKGLVRRVGARKNGYWEVQEG